MAVETPSHGQRRGLAYQRHTINSAVAGGAADALCNVNAVIEVDVIGKDVNSLPVDRLVCGKTFANRRKHGSVGPKLRMTGHAGFGGRQTCKTGLRSTEVWQ